MKFLPFLATLLVSFTCASGPPSIQADAFHHFDVQVHQWNNSVENLTLADGRWVGLSNGRIVESHDAVNWKVRFIGNDWNLFQCIAIEEGCL